MQNRPKLHRRQRPLIKQGLILETLRRQIVEGKLAPETQLPTHVKLGKAFNVTGVTVQRALRRLTQDGYIYARKKRGTFVVPYPPHHWQYGVVFLNRRDDPHNSLRWWTAVADEAVRITQKGPRRMLLYYGFGHHRESADYQRCLADLARHRLAGLLFAAPIFEISHLPPVTAPGLPRVIMAEPTAEKLVGVDVDRASFVNRALEYLAAQGRRRIAVVDSSRAFGEGPSGIIETSMWLEKIAARGLASGPQWIQGIDISIPRCAEALMKLLFYAGTTCRPDALIIADDNLTEAVVSGLVTTGLRVPEEVSVISHCNFPWKAPGPLPITLLGFDMREWFRKCLECLDQQRRGETPATMTRIPARFQDELSSLDPADFDHESAELAAAHAHPPTKAPFSAPRRTSAHP